MPEVIASHQVDDLDPEVVKKLEQEFGEVTFVRTKAGWCGFRVATLREYQRYQTLLIDEKTRAQASQIFAEATNVHPGKVEFGKYLERYPAITLTCASAALELSGLEVDPLIKKYAKGPA